MQFIDICIKFAQAFLPQECLLCGSACGRQQLCPECLADLPQIGTGGNCPVCALPAAFGETCGACIKSPPHFDATIAAFEFGFPVDALLRSLKYQGRLVVAEPIGARLADAITSCSSSPIDLMIPMPLHQHRLRERGFNQAAEIAHIVFRETGIRLERDIALRIRPTEPQAGLPLSQRGKNMKGAFACSQDLTGKRVAIIDDVMTSGASLNELAKTLKAAGAARVECWVAARTLRG